ncbi:MAG: hypothetical protein JWN25_1589 [Verrucomicrobiales bacterium]|nr:hypothetical protein [Verrucomicrobiales bacterium]MDB6129775.1 hypothetical protein [Verrucomicrobiales bacterium]
MRHKDIALDVKIALRKGEPFVLPGAEGEVRGDRGLKSDRADHEVRTPILVLHIHPLQSNECQETGPGGSE